MIRPIEEKNYVPPACEVEEQQLGARILDASTEEYEIDPTDPEFS